MIFRDLGVEQPFVKTSNLDEIVAAIRNTKVLYIEPPSNPPMELTDIRPVRNCQKSYYFGIGFGIILFNTFFTKAAFIYGAEVVFTFITKFITGHADMLEKLILQKEAL